MEVSRMSAEERLGLDERFDGSDAASIHIMTPQEAWERFDRAARRNLRIGGQEFLDAWDAGKFDDDPDRPELMRTIMLRPVGR
jgi:hypothetical protein